MYHESLLNQQQMENGDLQEKQLFNNAEMPALGADHDKLDGSYTSPVDQEVLDSLIDENLENDLGADSELPEFSDKSVQPSEREEDLVRAPIP